MFRMKQGGYLSVQKLSNECLDMFRHECLDMTSKVKFKKKKVKSNRKRLEL